VSEIRRRLEPLPLGDSGLPYSKGLMARALVATGLPAFRAYELAVRVESDLRQRGVQHVDLDRLTELAGEVLGEVDGERTSRRLRRYQRFRELDLPIIILIGGATGTGKSTVATEVAHRLGITRVTSTDFIRQTMRAFFSADFMPSVHYSSFEAGEALPPQEREAGDPLIVGFLDQTRHVLTGVNASIERALHEGWSMVLEGVHLVPGMLPQPVVPALVVHVVTSVANEHVHAQHFWVRDVSSGGTRAHDKYLDRLADIRHLQDFILEEARRADVPIIDHRTIEDSVAEVMEIVLDRAEALQREVVP
jgi:2-phosphoglycerate kinase